MCGRVRAVSAHALFTNDARSTTWEAQHAQPSTQIDDVAAEGDLDADRLEDIDLDLDSVEDPIHLP